MSLHLLSSLSTDPERLMSFEDCFSGYHRVFLEKPYHLDHVSQNLCELLGYSAEELWLHFGKNYSLMVCEPDRAKFLCFLDALAEKEQTLTLQYRMQKKDGTIFPVYNTITSRRMDDGKMYGFSIVSDVSGIPESKSIGDIVSSVLPYGFLQCTCEKYPKITYINKQLKDYLYMGDNPNKSEKIALENIYFMIPFEEREKFTAHLEEAQTTSEPIKIEHHVFRKDGTRAHLTGWLNMVSAENGKNEFTILYRQLDDTASLPEQIQDTSYFPVLRRAYNIIFKIDIDSSMAECIHWHNESAENSMLGVQMTLDSAKQFFLKNYIFSEDRPMMTNYMDQICRPNDNWDGRSVLQSEFRLKTSNGELSFLCVAVHLDEMHVLLCCRDITDTVYFGSRDLESKTLHSLYYWMDFLSNNRNGNLGMLMLEENANGCSLLYGTASVLHYLGLDTEESSHRSIQPSLDECLASANMTKDDFDRMVAGKPHLLWSRSAPEMFQFQISCNTYHSENLTLYVIWCSKNAAPPEEEQPKKRVFARTFGHFDLFLDNTPITFSSSKEKELIALLIDRNGGTLSPTEAISYLWEDEPADEHTSARYRKLAMGLKRTLEKYGIEDILINHKGIRSINTSAICCDYYELLAGNAKYRQAFNNTYMTDYGWGEETLATLWNYS